MANLIKNIREALHLEDTRQRERENLKKQQDLLNELKKLQDPNLELKSVKIKEEEDDGSNN